jgi:hypothetical protein
MVFMSQNSHIYTERPRPDTLPVVVRTNCSLELSAAALRFEWQLRNGCIDAAQLPLFREFLKQLGSC